MILTFTPNPCLDRTLGLSGVLERGGVNRIAQVRVQAGGKGINVARVLAASGVPVTAVFPAGVADPLLPALRQVAPANLQVRCVHLPANARVNTTVTEPDGTTTKLNEPGQALTAAQCQQLEQALLTATGEACPSWVVFSGSLPPGAPVAWYAHLVAAVRRRNSALRIAVDTADAPLLALAQELGKIQVDLLKPNAQELGQLAGLDRAQANALEVAAAQGDYTPVVRAARALVGRGVGAVLATLGGAGAVLVTTGGAWQACAPQVQVASTVGAGDSSVAGYLLAALHESDGSDAPLRLRSAVRYGSAAASLPGTNLPTPADLPTEPIVVARLE